MGISFLHLLLLAFKCNKDFKKHKTAGYGTYRLQLHSVHFYSTGTAVQNLLCESRVQNPLIES